MRGSLSIVHLSLNIMNIMKLNNLHVIIFTKNMFSVEIVTLFRKIMVPWLIPLDVEYSSG